MSDDDTSGMGRIGVSATPRIELRGFDLCLRDISCSLMGLGMGTLVALEGSPPWQVARAVMVVAVCTGVAVAARRAPRAAAVAALLVGIVIATAGGTIGVSHLTWSGPSLKAVAGVVAFAGGLGATLLSAASLLRTARGWRRLLAIPVAVVLVWVLVKPLWAAVYATNVPRPELGSATPQLLGMEYEEATFTTADGVDLSGWYIPSSNGAAVVLLHGASSTLSHVLAHAQVLARLGYGVLMFDARGHGRSEGRAMEFGWNGELDTSAAVQYLSGRPDVDGNRIGAVGMSMGGEQVIGAMATDERIKAAVAEGATHRVLADQDWLVEEFGVRGRVQQVINRLEFVLVDLFAEAPEPISLRESVEAAAPRPLLLIAAGRVPDEQRANRSIQAVSPQTVELWVVPGAGHTEGLRRQPEEWEERVGGFLGRELAHALPGVPVEFRGAPGGGSVAPRAPSPGRSGSARRPAIRPTGAGTLGPMDSGLLGGSSSTLKARRSAWQIRLWLSEVDLSEE